MALEGIGSSIVARSVGSGLRFVADAVDPAGRDKSRKATSPAVRLDGPLQAQRVNDALSAWANLQNGLAAKAYAEAQLIRVQISQLMGHAPAAPPANVGDAYGPQIRRSPDPGDRLDQRA